MNQLSKEIEARASSGEKLSTSVEMPFTPAAERVLKLAAEEADRLKHDYIGAEHLLLGLIREGQSPTSSLLEQKAVRADAVRDAILRALNEGEPGAESWKSRPCCFCGGNFPIAASAVLVVISSVEANRKYRQNLYAHPHCLRARVRPDLPLITDSAEE